MKLTLISVSWTLLFSGASRSKTYFCPFLPWCRLKSFLIRNHVLKYAYILHSLWFPENIEINISVWWLWHILGIVGHLQINPFCIFRTETLSNQKPLIEISFCFVWFAITRKYWNQHHLLLIIICLRHCWTCWKYSFCTKLFFKLFVVYNYYNILKSKLLFSYFSLSWSL